MLNSFRPRSGWQGTLIDIYIGLVIVCVLIVAIFVLSLRIGRKLSPRVAFVAIGVAMACVMAFAAFTRDALWMTRLFPFSNAIVFAQWQTLAMAVVAGLAWWRIPGHVAKRIVVIVALASICLYHAFAPLFAKPPQLDNEWRGDVCMQTSESSCSPAAAATLLRECGIEATEREMASLCLTSPKGTSMLGLYRGLKIKTRGTPWEIRPFSSASITKLRDAKRLPAILSVSLQHAADADPRYQTHWGWMPGVMHTVVVYGFGPDDHIDMGDPAVGREGWSLDALRTLWHGDGIEVVDKRSS